MNLQRSAAITVACVLNLCAPALAKGPLKHVGDCAQTTIKQVTTRLQDGDSGKSVPGSGSAVFFANGLYQVSYDTVAAIDASRAGDPARICLTSIPQDCPKGDDRGYEYRTTNLRTHQTWRLPDSEHMCGGA